MKTRKTEAISGRRATWRGELPKHLILLFVILFAFVPFYLMIVISFKDNVQFVNNPWVLDHFAQWHWENWTHAWHTVSNYLANSIVTSVGAVVCGMAMAVMASYVFGRYKLPGGDLLYYLLIALMFLPSTAANLVTLFTLLKRLHLVNTLLALVICGAIGGQVLCVFVLRQFVEDIPDELFEAAEVDGASHFQKIRHILVPMSGSILGTLAILQFIGSWNELMLPLILIRDDVLLTVPVGLMRLDGEYVKQWGQLMAGYTLSSIPLVVIFAFSMRLFVKGLTAGAIKG